VREKIKQIKIKNLKGIRSFLKKKVFNKAYFFCFLNLLFENKKKEKRTSDKLF
jgi:hypothetical protein